MNNQLSHAEATYRSILASAHATGLPPKSVHTVICSPPYYGLRAYAGDQLVDWPAVTYSPIAGLAPIEIPPMRCGLGAEPTIEAFIGHLIIVAREMWRVLRDDGVFWCNLGDSYAGYHGNKNSKIPSSATNGWTRGTDENGRGDKRPQDIKLKPKDLMMIPARFALAAQADGWTLRQDIIWHKKAPMTESVTDRCTKAHEYVFMLTKKPRYFFDNEAIKETATRGHAGSLFTEGKTAEARSSLAPIGKPDRVEDGKRNKRSVWTLGPSPYPGAHFATYPPALVEPMILASTSARGVCPKCGAQWRRLQCPPGWMPTCTCNAGEPIPATVLDPFVGSGTTLLVATELGRHAIGVDISSEYLTNLVPQRMASATKKKPKKSGAKPAKVKEFKQIELFTEG